VYNNEGIVLGIQVSLRTHFGPTGQQFSSLFQTNCWAVGPFMPFFCILSPQGVALGWVNGCSFGAISLNLMPMGLAFF
jgi:hypothetical protein